MKDEEFDKKVDWLVSHGMSFPNAMILISYCEIQNKPIPMGYVDLLDRKENVGEK